jgi:hypothetical protein
MTGSDPINALESLGPYTKIPADGGCVEHVEHWYLFKKDLAEEEESLDHNLVPLIERNKMQCSGNV